MGYDLIQKLSAPSLEAAKELIKRHPEWIGSGVGAAAATGIQYARNLKRGKSKTPEQASAQEGLKKATESVKREKTFSTEVGAAKAKTKREIADIMAKHPLRGALMAAPIGATAGGGAVAATKWLRALAKK